MPARDGVAPATDISLPAGDGPFPVILSRTPYNKNDPYLADAEQGHDTTGEDIGSGTRMIVAENGVWHERSLPSRLVLPVIPAAPPGEDPRSSVVSAPPASR